METQNLAQLYELEPLEWAPIERRLAAGMTQAPGTGGPNRHTCWLATVDADGAPHLNGIGGLWLDGAFYFETGESTAQARNLARDPHCSFSVATEEFDLVVAGTAERVVDRAVVADIAARFAADGWPCEVDESGVALTASFSAPSAGPPPWAVYRLTPQRATALQTVEPGGATSWTFA